MRVCDVFDAANNPIARWLRLCTQVESRCPAKSPPHAKSLAARGRVLKRLGTSAPYTDPMDAQPATRTPASRHRGPRTARLRHPARCCRPAARPSLAVREGRITYSHGGERWTASGHALRRCAVSLRASRPYAASAPPPAHHPSRPAKNRAQAPPRAHRYRVPSRTFIRTRRSDRILLV